MFIGIGINILSQLGGGGITLGGQTFALTFDGEWYTLQVGS